MEIQVQAFGYATNDELNSLVLRAGLHWREVDLLRTYVGYAFQSGAVTSRVSAPTALSISKCPPDCITKP